MNVNPQKVGKNPVESKENQMPAALIFLAKVNERSPHQVSSSELAPTTLVDLGEKQNRK